MSISTRFDQPEISERRQNERATEALGILLKHAIEIGAEPNIVAAPEPMLSERPMVFAAPAPTEDTPRVAQTMRLIHEVAKARRESEGDVIAARTIANRRRFSIGCVPILAWTDAICKWIEGDNHLACGLAGHPFCPAHSRLVYRKWRRAA